MDTSLFKGSVTDPQLNLRNCQAITWLSSAFPSNTLRAGLPGIIDPTDQVNYRPLTAVAPEFAWIVSGGELLVWVGGTTGSVHLSRLLDGWSDPNAVWQESYGACKAFHDAARYIMDQIGPADLGTVQQAFLVGFSYGGATVQAMAALLRGAGLTNTRIWSYGSPRAGLYRLGTLLEGMANTRVYCDNDPVRYIPPHSSEVPALTALDSWQLVQGCNTQVQAPTGWKLLDDGVLQRTEGEPVHRNAVALSIATWVVGSYGFGSTAHSISNYVSRFNLAYQALNPIVMVGTIRPREAGETLTIRQREVIVEEGVQDIENALDTAPNFNTEFAVPPLPVNSPLRYVRRRVGNVWGVKLGNQVVALGPGKRKARTLARGFNKAARAGW